MIDTITTEPQEVYEGKVAVSVFEEGPVRLKFTSKDRKISNGQFMFEKIKRKNKRDKGEAIFSWRSPLSKGCFFIESLPVMENADGTLYIDLENPILRTTGLAYMPLVGSRRRFLWRDGLHRRYGM